MRLSVLKFVRKWHLPLFVSAMILVILSSYNLVILLVGQNWITVPVAAVLDVAMFAIFNWTHYQAIRLTREAMYLFGTNVEKNFIMKFMIHKYGFRRTSFLTTLVANEALIFFTSSFFFDNSFILNQSLVGPRVSVEFSLVVALISSLDYLNDLIATKTINALMNRDDDFSIYVKLLPHPVQEKRRFWRRKQ